MALPPLRHERIRGDGVTLHAVVAGTGPPVVLLHGFPEHWRSWQKQLPALAEAGFSAWALDMRGCGESDAPADPSAYHLRRLVADVAATIRATGHPRAHLVGHDWGGIVGWTFAGQHPDLLDRLVIVNAPHMDIYMGKVWRTPQLLRSWYVALFQIPGLAERLLSAGNFAAVRRMFRNGPYRPGAFSDEDIRAYVRALSRPGHLTAALNYYRVNRAADAMHMARSARVTARTLVIWGERDPALSVSLLEGLQDVAPSIRIERLANAGHWAQNEAPQEVNGVIVEFLRGA